MSGRKTIGDNSHGFDNKTMLANALDGRTFGSVNPNLRNLLKDAFSAEYSSGKIRESSRVSVTMTPEHKSKSDFFISMEGIRRTVYLKIHIGNGNSIHQEKLPDFLAFLRSVSVDEDTIEDYLYYHYCDGTKDNTGK